MNMTTAFVLVLVGCGAPNEEQASGRAGFGGRGGGSGASGGSHEPGASDAALGTGGARNGGFVPGGGGAAGAGDPGGAPMPSFASWAWSAPDVSAVVHAGFRWFESGYPGTLPASDNQYLTQNGTRPFAYVNMAEVPNDDAYLQSLIGPWYSEIKLCDNTSWNTTIVDVRDSRWQSWLITRANDAYGLGNTGIKWDVAGVEHLCDDWASNGGAAAQQEALDAMGSVLAKLKAQHPDFEFIVNQGFGLAEQHPGLVDGVELENLINYSDANPGDQWSTDLVARVNAIHATHGTPILDLEYIDLFGCSDTSCAYATQLYEQIVALGWVPYLTNTHMNIQGRGLDIVPPW